MSNVNGRLILSVGDQWSEFNLDDFIQTLDQEINAFKKPQNNTDHIKIISTNGKEKIYINYLNQSLEAGLSNSNSIVDFYSDETLNQQVDLKEMVKRNEEAKNESEDIWEEDPFINRKQRLNVNTSNKGELPFDVNTLTNMLESKNSGSKKETNYYTVNGYKVLVEPEELGVKPEELGQLNLEKANIKFEDGLKAKLAAMASEKLMELELNSDERIIECKEYCSSVLYPLFIHLKHELKGYNRDANITFNLELLTVSIEVRYRNKLEYDYVVQIKNPTKSPVLQVKTTDIKGSLKVRPNLTDVGIDCLSREDVFKDFLGSYKKHLYSSLAY